MLKIADIKSADDLHGVIEIVQDRGKYYAIISHSTKNNHVDYSFIDKNCYLTNSRGFPYNDGAFKSTRQLIQKIKSKFIVQRFPVKKYISYTGYWGHGSKNITKYCYLLLGIKYKNRVISLRNCDKRQFFSTVDRR